MADHALLSPSSSSRWISCPPSARLCESIEEETSSFAQEGTDAHALCEYKLNKALGNEAEDPRPELEFYNEEMESCADEYALYVMQIYHQMKDDGADPLIAIEAKLDISSYVPECSGTGDCIIVSDGKLHIIDFKYGRGVLVEAEHNTQMMLYALGALGMFSSLYEIEDIAMTIFQPRLSNISTFEMKREDLENWANQVLKEKAQLAFEGGGEFCSGSHCRFCKVRSTCRERANANLSLARYEFAIPPLLDDTEISAILIQAEELASWVADLRGYAFSVLIGGGYIDGFKLVEGRSVRTYTDEEAVAKAVKEAGFDPYEHKVLGITAMMALLGKSRFNELLTPFVFKPRGKPTMAPSSDKRPEMIIGKQDFMEETT